MRAVPSASGDSPCVVEAPGLCGWCGGHRPLVHRIISKAKKRFDIKVYEIGIASNHIHLAAKGKTRSSLQNFFRVVAGHIAQEILRELPIKPGEKSRGGAPSTARGGAPTPAPTTAPAAPKPKTRERENKFWQTRIYTRIVSWGRDFRAVIKYIIQNTKEALGLIPYQERKPKRKLNDDTS